MKKLIIQGCKKLSGEVDISGSKNDSLPIICASLLTEHPVILHNIPSIEDIKILLKIIKNINVKVLTNSNKSIKIIASKINKFKILSNLTEKIRASILLLSPLISRFGKAIIKLPGGCMIGKRPIDQHIKIFKSLGVKIKIKGELLIADCKCLIGSYICLDTVSVTGTENALMVSVLAKGITTIVNAALEPEIIDLSEFLISMGALIFGHGTNRIYIKGVKKLYGINYKVIFDRIEAGTFLCAVAVIGGKITLHRVNPFHMKYIIKKLNNIGLKINIGNNCIHASMNNRPKPIDITTSEYPGFITDMQSQFMVINTVAQGNSIIVENIFENRFMHVNELSKLGANIKIENHIAKIKGIKNLYGCKVKATDLRASAGLIIAGLASKGLTYIENIYHLYRGYDNLVSKLNSLGAKIKIISNNCT